MGWFDRKNPSIDDIDDPQPQQAAPKPAAAKPAAAKPAAAATPAATAATAAPAAKASMPTQSAKSSFGIEKAIELMRNLPDDNEQLVVTVVRTTLESANVSVEAIIDDAELKQAKIENRVDALKKEIAEYEEEIAARKDEIRRLEEDHAETTAVRKKLELSLKPQDSAPGAPVASIPRATTPKPAKPETSAFSAPKSTSQGTIKLP